ncbi:MAG: histidine kinase [Bacteroides cellulosilyticus]
MDYLSSFPLTLLSIMGGGMTVLLRLWILENQRVMQLEKIRLQSEIEHLKEQISPSMLFRVLHYSGEQALVNPGKASKMLMKLSQILRYQLYDCNREKVLLNTEIKFLTNYLELEQLVSGKFDFHMNASGETGRTFCIPIAFHPFYTVHRKTNRNTRRTSCIH